MNRRKEKARRLPAKTEATRNTFQERLQSRIHLLEAQTHVLEAKDTFRELSEREACLDLKNSR